jgi:hypothetical protein
MENECISRWVHGGRLKELGGWRLRQGEQGGLRDPSSLQRREPSVVPQESLLFREMLPRDTDLPSTRLPGEKRKASEQRADRLRMEPSVYRFSITCSRIRQSWSHWEREIPGPPRTCKAKGISFWETVQPW